MPVCARAIQQQDGSYLLALDPSVTDVSTCAYAVETGSESSFASLAAMTIDDAQVIATAVGVLWAIAWGIRQLRDAILVPERTDDV